MVLNFVTVLILVVCLSTYSKYIQDVLETFVSSASLEWRALLMSVKPSSSNSFKSAVSLLMLYLCSGKTRGTLLFQCYYLFGSLSRAFCILMILHLVHMLMDGRSSWSIDPMTLYWWIHCYGWMHIMDFSIFPLTSDSLLYIVVVGKCYFTQICEDSFCSLISWISCASENNVYCYVSIGSSVCEYVLFCISPSDLTAHLKSMFPYWFVCLNDLSMDVNQKFNSILLLYNHFPPLGMFLLGVPILSV